MKIGTDTIILAAAVGAGLLIVYYGKQAVTTAAQAVNPVNNNNIINRAANAAIGLDNKTGSIGTMIYDWIHPDYATSANAPTAAKKGR